MSRVLDWDITVPYRWTCGPIYGRFLGGLKEKQIFGVKCSSCARVYCPPQEVCPACYVDFTPEDFVPLGDEGEIVSFTVIEQDLFGPKPDETYLNSRIHPATLESHPLLWPPEAPYAMVLIKIDGADSSLLHLVKGEEMDSLAIGGRVRAVWKEEPEGCLLDLERFAVI